MKRVSYNDFLHPYSLSVHDKGAIHGQSESHTPSIHKEGHFHGYQFTLHLTVLPSMVIAPEAGRTYLPLRRARAVGRARWPQRG